MSKEWERYEASCASCGNVGGLAMWSDDWNRWGADWDGFSGRVYPQGPALETVTCKKCGGANVSLRRKSN